MHERDIHVKLFPEITGHYPQPQITGRLTNELWLAAHCYIADLFTYLKKHQYSPANTYIWLLFRTPPQCTTLIAVGIDAFLVIVRTVTLMEQFYSTLTAKSTVERLVNHKQFLCCKIEYHNDSIIVATYPTLDHTENSNSSVGGLGGLHTPYNCEKDLS